MHLVLPNALWLGNAFDVRQPRLRFDTGISAVVDLAYEEPPAQLPRQLTYCRFPLNDGGGNESRLLSQALLTTTNFLNLGIPLLVGCSAGMSRSPTVAAFALAQHLNQAPQEVLDRIAKIKSVEVHPELWADCASALANL